ncbi:MAG: transcription factor S [Candidatus Hodarchaeota archaeon]
MEFCECGALMMPKKDENGNILLVCGKCGKTISKESSGGYTISSKIEKSETIVIQDPSKSTSFSFTKIKCPSCDSMEAYYWMEQTRNIDEPPTRFYRCKKCGKTWRETW